MKINSDPEAPIGEGPRRYHRVRQGVFHKQIGASSADLDEAIHSVSRPRFVTEIDKITADPDGIQHRTGSEQQEKYKGSHSVVLPNAQQGQAADSLERKSLTC